MTFHLHVVSLIVLHFSSILSECSHFFPSHSYTESKSILENGKFFGRNDGQRLSQKNVLRPQLKL